MKNTEYYFLFLAGAIFMASLGIVMICFMSWTIIVAKNARKELLEGEQGNFELQGKGSCEIYQVQSFQNYH